MRVLVCGSRSLALRHFPAVVAALQQYRATVVIEGGAPGADRLGRAAAAYLGVPWETYEARWRRLGNYAGPERNGRMLAEGRPQLVLAFHTDPELGRGTADMVRQARQAGLPVEVHLMEEVTP